MLYDLCAVECFKVGAFVVAQLKCRLPAVSILSQLYPLDAPLPSQFWKIHLTLILGVFEDKFSGPISHNVNSYMMCVFVFGTEVNYKSPCYFITYTEGVGFISRTTINDKKYFSNTVLFIR